MSPGGRVLSGRAARAWIRGIPGPDADPLEYFFDLPIDEQRHTIAAAVTSGREADDPLAYQKRRLWWYGQAEQDREAYIADALERLQDLADTRKEKQ
jgi:hypothetical protein